MPQWGVQLVIGKLLTDDEFRRRFERRPECLARLRERGIDLSDTEIAAIVEADPRVWSTMADLIDYRLRNIRLPSNLSRQRGQRSLTQNEQHVLRGVFDGLTNKQIAVRLGVSEGAVKARLQHLFRKTHVRTRAQLVRVAIEHSLALRREDDDQTIRHRVHVSLDRVGCRTRPDGPHLVRSAQSVSGDQSDAASGTHRDR
jgi:DNA-binding CsgD family transcriptional regulator